MKKLTLEDVKNFKYESGEWTLNGEKLFTNMLDEKYEVNFKFKVNNEELIANYIIYAYGVGPAIQYKDNNGNVRIYPIGDLLNLNTKKEDTKKETAKKAKEPSPETLKRYYDAQNLSDEEFELRYGIPKHFYE